MRKVQYCIVLEKQNSGSFHGLAYNHEIKALHNIHSNIFCIIIIIFIIIIIHYLFLGEFGLLFSIDPLLLLLLLREVLS